MIVQTSNIKVTIFQEISSILEPVGSTDCIIQISTKKSFGLDQQKIRYIMVSQIKYNHKKIGIKDKIRFTKIS